MLLDGDSVIQFYASLYIYHIYFLNMFIILV